MVNNPGTPNVHLSLSTAIMVSYLFRFQNEWSELVPRNNVVIEGQSEGHLEGHSEGHQSQGVKIIFFLFLDKLASTLTQLYTNAIDCTVDGCIEFTVFAGVDVWS